MATGLATAFATAASAQTPPSPAAGVTPGVERVGGQQYVFYTGTDGTVWQKRVNGGAATSVGGVLVSGPSPIYDGSHILVFGEGTDNALWYTTCQPGGICSGWTSLGGRLTSKPGASDIDASHYSVYVRGTDGAVWARDYSTGWSAWHSVGGRLLSGTGPSAAYRGGSQHVLAVGTDRHLWLERIGGPGFGPVGGTTDVSPALVNSYSGLVGFARGTNGAGYYSKLGGSWNSMGPAYLTSGVGAAGGPRPTADNNTYTVGLGGDNEVWMNHGDWSAATPTFGGWNRVTP